MSWLNEVNDETTNSLIGVDNNEPSFFEDYVIIHTNKEDTDAQLNLALKKHLKNEKKQLLKDTISEKQKKFSKTQHDKRLKDELNNALKENEELKNKIKQLEEIIKKSQFIKFSNVPTVVYKDDPNTLAELNRLKPHRLIVENPFGATVWGVPLKDDHNLPTDNDFNLPIDILDYNLPTDLITVPKQTFLQLEEENKKLKSSKQREVDEKENKKKLRQIRRQQKVVQDANYLKYLSQNKMDINNLKNIMSTPIPGIGNTIKQRLIAFLSKCRIYHMDELIGKFYGLGKKRLERLKAIFYCNPNPNNTIINPKQDIDDNLPLNEYFESNLPF
jgi:hypothetical protein